MKTSRIVNLRFEGTAIDALLKGLWLILTTIPIVTTAWGMVPFYRWFNNNTVTSDGRRFSLEGRPANVWLLMAGFTLANFVRGLAQGAAQQETSDQFDPATILLGFGLFIIVQLFTWGILKWYISHTRLDDTIALRFRGGAIPFIGWMILSIISIFTIIGWAWVNAAIIRWVLRNIDAPNMTFVFTGRGHEVLWRSLVALLGSIFIVTIPWVWLWLTKWFVASTHIECDQIS
ncbi:hypothetical protein [Desulfovibrio inopinatus]|uniref:hypothetical protein n=1 Tax=Desulfovibrio inopinatus TaxID=102109 RepID=UPI00040609B1|nr:hypothetical protein [Desulfovibrio inopinatus]